MFLQEFEEFRWPRLQGLRQWRHTSNNRSAVGSIWSRPRSKEGGLSSGQPTDVVLLSAGYCSISEGDQAARISLRCTRRRGGLGSWAFAVMASPTPPAEPEWSAVLHGPLASGS